jgi:hypothetical protein
VILATSMAGTTMSDFMNRDASAKYLAGGASKLDWGQQGLGRGYPTGAAILISILLAIFHAWKLSGMTFQIRDIVTFKGESLFWSAILVSNTLGTSMGDSLSDSSGLGYAGGALLVTGRAARRARGADEADTSPAPTPSPPPTPTPAPPTDGPPGPAPHAPSSGEPNTPATTPEPTTVPEAQARFTRALP